MRRLSDLANARRLIKSSGPDQRGFSSFLVKILQTVTDAATRMAEHCMHCVISSPTSAEQHMDNTVRTNGLDDASPNLFFLFLSSAFPLHYVRATVLRYRDQILLTTSQTDNDLSWVRL
jgi:hypothetical protein